MSEWTHLTWSTKGTWLPGDPRGFRSRDHRIHSTGDYKRPPPPGEHAGLHRYGKRSMAKASREAIRLTDEHRRIVLETLRRADGDRMQICLAVSATHVHALVRIRPNEAKRVAVRLKRKSSHALRALIPGAVWARGCGARLLRDREHLHEAERYVMRHAELEGAAVWHEELGASQLQSP